MKLALLKGNRFNPWHLQAFTMLGDDTQVTAFRAESEIQEYFKGRGDGSLDFAEERLYFDTQQGAAGVLNTIRERYFGYRPQVLPFADRLQGYDLIQTWELFTDWTDQALEAKARYGIPVSLMFWDNIAFNNESSLEWIARKKRAIAAADRFIVHTERSRRVLLMEGADPERIVTLPPGVDTQHFSPGKSDRGKYGLSDDEYTILFIGWMLPRKGLDFLVLALRELMNDPELNDTKFRLAIVASGPGRDRIENIIDRAGVGENVTFLGTYPYEQMPDLYRAADCFVLPSIATPEWQEQFGMSLIEAMACGIPVVTTYSGAIPEIAGDATLLCQPNDFLSLYDAIRSIATGDTCAVDLSKAGRARVEELYTLEQYAAGLRRLYAELLG